jgi:hypothetical protein
MSVSFHVLAHTRLFASGFLNLSPPKYELVVEDCDVAVRLDPLYIKVINRRGTALEALERYEEALYGMCYPLHSSCHFRKHIHIPRIL